MRPRSHYRGPKTAQRAASHQTNGYGLENQSRTRPFLPIDGDSNRNQNGPGSKQTRCGSDDLLPHPFETINLRRQLACDATTDTQDTHGPTSLNSPDRLLVGYYSGNCEWMPASNDRIWERSCSEMLVSSRYQNRQVPAMSTNESQLATAALETLHGARGLAPAEATAKLRDFMDSIGTIVPPTAHLSEASGALRTLINQLESDGSATDDTWEDAIETMLSFANESAWISEA
jgi:hypothetical protein